MMLEMYLDGHLVDTTSVCQPLLKTEAYLKSLVADLENKYASILKKFAVKPVYVLCGVPSRMNDFVPLSHPQNSKTAVPALPTTIQQPMATTKLNENLQAVGAATTTSLMKNKAQKVA